MRHISFALFIFLSMNVLTAAQTTVPRTVTDFYLALPDIYFTPDTMIDGPNAITTYRKSMVKVSDNKNGYLRIERPSSEGNAEVAIFRKTDGNYLIAIVQNGCGPSCSTEKLDVLSYDGGKWTDVKSSVWPTISESALAAAYVRHKVAKENRSGLIVYELPRVGRTVSAVTGDDDVKVETLFDLNWDGGKFSLASK